MDEKDARYHMKRCVDSGLWIPEANKGSGEEVGPETSTSGNEGS